MNRAPHWTPEEFALLVDSPLVAAEALAADDLTGRSTGAITVVREGIHSFHSGESNPRILSGMMVDFLAARRGNLVCSVCHERV